MAAQDTFDHDVEIVMKNLNAEIKGIEGRSLAGLLAAGFKVEAESNRNVPVEYGNLRGSSYTRKDMDNENAVEVGYTSPYGLYVHENLEMKLAGQPRPSGLGTYWNPGGPKFLERAVVALKQIIVDTVAQFAKVK